MARERRTFEVEDNRAEQYSSGGRQSLKMPAGLSLWQPKRVGTYKVEFIPFLVTEAHNRFHPEFRFSKPGRWYPERTYFVHGGIGVDNAVLTCPLKTFGKPCPICEARARLTKSPRKEDEDRAYELKPKERQLYLVIERNDRGELERDIKLWEVSFFNFGKQLQSYLDGSDPEDRARYKRYYHPEHGLTVRLNATEEMMGGGGGGKYLKFFVHEMRERREPLDLDLFDHGYDLDDMVRVLDYDALKRAFLGVDEDDEPAAPPRADAGRPAAPPRADAGRPAARSAPPADDDPPPARSRPAPRPEPEPEPAAPAKGRAYKFASRDVVSFLYKDERREGVIESINMDKGVAYVRVEGRERPMTLDFDEMTLVRADDTFDAKPAKAVPPADDPPPGRPPARPAPRAASSDAPAARRGRWDDEDDEPAAPPPRGKATPPADDDPPPAGRW